MYKTDLDPTSESNYLALYVDIGIKWSIIDDNSFMLWHRRLEHIFIERIKMLVNGVLKTLDFIDFDTCMNWILVRIV